MNAGLPTDEARALLAALNALGTPVQWRAEGGQIPPRTCTHTDTVPVETITPHLPESAPVVAVVAHLCTSCDAQLPMNWGCGDCEWTSVRLLCEPAATLHPARPCPAHDTAAHQKAGKIAP